MSLFSNPLTALSDYVSLEVTLDVSACQGKSVLDARLNNKLINGR